MTEMVQVKIERPDEAEIRELAAKMVEANKAKQLQQAQAARPPVPLGAAAIGPGGQVGIANYFQRKPTGNGVPAAGERRDENGTERRTPAQDEASWKGHFGWDVLGKCHIPYIFRAGEKYVAVRMVEVKLLNKYLNYLHQDIYSCTCIRSYYITEVEARLLNEINQRHCDLQFGRESFTQKDLVVRLADANEFYNFLDVCYNKLLRGTIDEKDKCGFIRINKESVVPYTVRDNMKFVPLFYFEGETDNLKLKADQLKGWDLSYLKFCCKVQGIRNELFASETCSVISLTDIKSYFPPGTEFEEYWPNKVVDSQLLLAAKGSMASSGGQWTRAPPAPPPGVGVSTAGPVAPGGVGSGRGRRPGTAQQRHTQASAMNAAAAVAMGAQHPGLNAVAVQAALGNWNFGTALTQAQVLRLAQQQAQMAQAQASHAAQRYSNSAAMTNHRAQPQQRTMQFPNSAISMAMGQQPPPPLVRSANANNISVQQQQQQQHQQQQQQQQQQSTMNGHPGQHTDNRKRLTPIPEVPTTAGNHTPYKVQKALVEGTMVPCINMKPFLYTDLLMTLPDLATHFFPRLPLSTCRAMLDALGVHLYKPNATQLQILRNSGKCKSAAAGDNGLALVRIQDVMQYMPQLKYMIRSEQRDDMVHPHPAHAHTTPHHQAPAHHQAAGAGPAKRARAS